MNPAAQLSLALLVGLGLWLPTLSATLAGEVDLLAAAVRYLVGFVLARVAIAGIVRLAHGYASEGDRAAADLPTMDEIEQTTAKAA